MRQDLIWEIGSSTFVWVSVRIFDCCVICFTCFKLGNFGPVLGHGPMTSTSGWSVYDQSMHFVISRVVSPHRYSETCHTSIFPKRQLLHSLHGVYARSIFYALKRTIHKGTRPETRVDSQNTEGKHEQSSKAAHRSII